MAFEIRIKPLVLFDLEDRIVHCEHEISGKGRQLYQTFLSGLHEIQSMNRHSVDMVYETVQKYVVKDLSCSLFYMITGNTILIMGVL